MREQFDLFELQDKTHTEAVCLLSAGHFANIDIVVVVPLIAGPPMAPTLPIHTAVEVNGSEYTAQLELIASIEASILGQKIGTARQHEYQIKDALDRLIAGY